MKTNERLHKVVDSSLAVEKAVLDEKYAFFSSDSPLRIVADYLSLMTDQYFLKQYVREFMPRKIDYDL